MKSLILALSKVNSRSVVISYIPLLDSLGLPVKANQGNLILNLIVLSFPLLLPYLFIALLCVYTIV